MTAPTCSVSLVALRDDALVRDCRLLRGLYLLH